MYLAMYRWRHGCGAARLPDTGSVTTARADWDQRFEALKVARLREDKLRYEVEAYQAFAVPFNEGWREGRKFQSTFLS